MNNNLYTGGYIPNQNIIPNMNNYSNNFQENYGNNYQTLYVEDYLRKNIGKRIEAHVSFCDSIEWRDSVFTGILEDVGKDYVVIQNNDNSYVIWSVYIDYIVLLNNYRK